ncbi:hypothetical protein FOZ60_001183 [Perkinsus olseni]|uniref:Uncharacterized protein n=1 Tax=Perkinsus olseni TaxID=32597 RepID=A0A7J6P206_PEROL|nr:hypothetical protein FOZ60_001183 [Perkinsus olseni]
MMYSIYYLGLLLPAASGVRSNLRYRDRHFTWIEPPNGHYVNKDLPKVANLPYLDLRIWSEEESQRPEFNLSLGRFAGRGFLVSVREMVSSRKTDRREKAEFSHGACFELRYADKTAVLRAFSEYNIPKSPTNLLHLCRGETDGWAVYFYSGRDDELNIREFHGPVPLVAVPESSEETDNKAAADKPESSPGKASKGKKRGLAGPTKGLYVGLVEGKREPEILQREIQLAVRPPNAQLSVIAPDRQVRVDLPVVPLNRTAEGCWRLEMRVEYEKPEPTIDEDTLAAFEDLAEVPGDRLGLDDFLLCYRDWQWELVLGTPPSRVVSLQRKVSKRRATRPLAIHWECWLDKVT